MVEDIIHFRLDYTSILYIYKVLKHLTIQWMVILTSQKHEGGLSWLNLSKNLVQTILLGHGLGQEPRQTDLDFYLIYT